MKSVKHKYVLNVMLKTNNSITIAYRYNNTAL